MAVDYVTMYKWEALENGTKEKFEGRINSLPWELSLRNKLGCADITMQAYLPIDMYDEQMEKQYNAAVLEYNIRKEKLSELVELILSKVSYNKKINDEYLYELWISRVFSLNWLGDSDSNNVLNQMKILYDALQTDSDINPFDIDINRKIIKEEKGIRKILSRFKKKSL